jgi:hypothetical protein
VASRDRDFFSIFHGQKRPILVYGLGSAFDENLALIKAWAEFLERYSFCIEASNHNRDSTTNGYAAHVFAHAARTTAIAELIERDMLLSAWVLRFPALKVPESELDQTARKIIETLARKAEASIALGFLGHCMGRFVGVAVAKWKNQYALFSSAKPSRKVAILHLLTQILDSVSAWVGGIVDEPLSSLEADAAPEDHRRFHVGRGDETLSWFISDSGQFRQFPDFNIRTVMLSEKNCYASKTNFDVAQAVSEECQDLWIGPTTPKILNWKRLALILGRPPEYENLNHTPHPLP